VSTAAREPAASTLPFSSYVCGTCGYGIRIAAPTLPVCPMCRADNWELPRDEGSLLAD
jgi:rubrerythrin